MRSNVYGSGNYGSGYTYATAGAATGLVAGSVASRGFPYYYWPVWYPSYPYYYGSSAYRDNNQRPGGAMTLYVLTAPPGVDQQQNNFGLYGDINSVASVFESIKGSCPIGTALQPNFTLSPNMTVQYYRASSFSLVLDGYNSNSPNITVDANGESNQTVTAATAPIPSGANSSYLACLNSTIGNAVPLLSDSATNAAGRLSHATIGLAPTLALLATLRLLM